MLIITEDNVLNEHPRMGVYLKDGKYKFATTFRIDDKRQLTTPVFFLYNIHISKLKLLRKFVKRGYKKYSLWEYITTSIQKILQQ